MSGYASLRLGWATTQVIRCSAPSGIGIATVTLGTGSVHAVETDRSVAVCGVEVCWPEPSARPTWPPRSAYACHDCVRLLHERQRVLPGATPLQS